MNDHFVYINTLKRPDGSWRPHSEIERISRWEHILEYMSHIDMFNMSHAIKEYIDWKHSEERSPIQASVQKKCT